MLSINMLTNYILLLCFLSLAACATSTNELHMGNDMHSAKTIYLVSHGWHAGIVVQRVDIPDNLWPETKNFVNAKYIEVGWGDQEYYQTPEAHLGIGIKAILWPTNSVLHIAGFNQPVASYFPLSEVIVVQISVTGFERMIRYIAASHYKNTNELAAQPIAKGLYGNSQFYSSNETYHIFNTCNVWTAKALQAAGCSTHPVVTVTAERLFSQVRSFAKVTKEKNATIRRCPSR